MKRKQFSDAQQKQFLDEWRASGLTGKQFADSHNFAAGNLWRWQRRHNDKASGNQFKPVLLRNDEPKSPVAQAKRLVAEVSLRGMTARLYAGIDSASVAQIVAALRGDTP